MTPKQLLDRLETMFREANKAWMRAEAQDSQEVNDIMNFLFEKMKNLEAPRMIARVAGGAFQGASATEPIDLLLIDEDNIEGGDPAEGCFIEVASDPADAVYVEDRFQVKSRSLEQWYTKVHGELRPEVMAVLVREGVWGEFPGHPRSDWREEAMADNTILGYWAWVSNQIQVHGVGEENDE